MLIFRKVITAKTVIIFSVIFAVTFEISRRWPGMIPIFAGLSAIVIVACVVMIRTRRVRVGLASDIGAVALLCGVFWGIGAFSDGIIYTPGGNAIDIHQHAAKSTGRINSRSMSTMKGRKLLMKWKGRNLSAKNPAQNKRTTLCTSRFMSGTLTVSS